MVKHVKGLMIAASLLMLMLLMSACGKAEADLPGTETEVEVQEEQTQEKLEDPSVTGKEETTEQEKEDTAEAGEDSETSANSETTEIPDDAVMIQDVAVRLLSVEADENIGLMRRTFEAYGDQAVIEKIFRGSNVVMEKDENEHKVIVTETAFFTSEDEVWKLSCLLDGEGEEYTFEKGQVTPIEQKEFLVSTESGDEAVVILTPYGVWIQATDNWMAMSEAYQFTAELADGSENEIVILPLTRSRQARSQEMKELPYLGDGYVLGEELQDENGDTRGGRFIFFEEVSLDDVVDVHIYQ